MSKIGFKFAILVKLDNWQSKLVHIPHDDVFMQPCLVSQKVELRFHTATTRALTHCLRYLLFPKTGNPFRNTSTDRQQILVWIISDEDFSIEIRRCTTTTPHISPNNQKKVWIFMWEKPLATLTLFSNSTSLSLSPSSVYSSRNFRPEIQDHPLTARLQRQRTENSYLK